MKRNGIINADISRVLSYMGHTDTLAVGDCGLLFYLFKSRGSAISSRATYSVRSGRVSSVHFTSVR